MITYDFETLLFAGVSDPVSEARHNLANSDKSGLHPNIATSATQISIFYRNFKDCRLDSFHSCNILDWCDTGLL